MCTDVRLLVDIFRFIFLFLLINIFIFHIDSVYECIVVRCIVENKLTYITQKNKLKNISVTAVRNLLASIVLTPGENCGVVYDKCRHFIFMACASACVVVNTAICVK